MKYREPFNPGLSETAWIKVHQIAARVIARLEYEKKQKDEAV